MSIEEFITHYVTPPALPGKQTTDPATTDKTSVSPAHPEQDASRTTSLDVYSAASIAPADLEACLDLVEQTSSEAYASSGAGWSRPKKRKEMKLPDMKYLIVRGGAGHSGREGEGGEAQRDVGIDISTKAADGPGSLRDPGTASNVLGFLSFMVTYEDGKEVVYCYEIHLASRARGRGLGMLLMRRMEEIGRLVGVEKAMLTVFKSNATARRFYERGGYEVDEYSPQPRRLRNGAIKEFDYLILSKRLE